MISNVPLPNFDRSYFAVKSFGSRQCDRDTECRLGNDKGASSLPYVSNLDWLHNEELGDSVSDVWVRDCSKVNN